MKRFWILSVLFLIAACGKNDMIRPVGTSMAPVPPGSSPYAPGGGFYPSPGGNGYPNGYPTGGGYYSPNFRPQMPANMPNQYAPFLPIDNYMRQTQQMQMYYQQMWIRWQQYAQMQRVSVYSFPIFWYEFAPTYMSASYGGMYQYFNTQFYSWVQPSTQIVVSDPTAFWGNYTNQYYYPIQTSTGMCYGCY